MEIVAKAPSAKGATSDKDSFIGIFLIRSHRLHFVCHPMPRVHTANGESRGEQGQRPVVAARKVVVQPDAECGAQERGDGH